MNSLADFTRTPPKNRYAMAAIDHVLVHCPGEKVVARYGTYHVPRRFFAHYSQPEQESVFYMGFFNLGGTCKHPARGSDLAHMYTLNAQPQKMPECAPR